VPDVSNTTSQRTAETSGAISRSPWAAAPCKRHHKQAGARFYSQLGRTPMPDSRLGISPPPRGNFSAASATTCPKTASCSSPAHVAPYCSALYRSSDF